MTDIKFPAIGTDVLAAHPSDFVLQMLASRRSSSATLLEEPGMSAEELMQVMRLASRVPDHRKVVPFRFITFADDDRDQFAEVLVTAASVRDDEVAALPADSVRGLIKRAPTLLALIFSPNLAHKTPVWEQNLTCGAVGYGLLLAASGLGYAGQWLSEWMAYDKTVDASLGLSADERVAGFFYFGTSTALPKERARPQVNEIISRWTPSA